MSFFRFLFSKSFLLNIVIAFILLLAGLFVLDKYLDGVTQHGVKVSVPNGVEKKISELEEVFGSKGFRYEVVDSIWNRKLPKGIVVDQKPAPGDSVKEGRKVYLTITARTDKMIKLSLGSMINGTSTSREALEYISSIDIGHHSTVAVPYDYDDIVLGFQDAQGNELKDGDKIKAGSKVKLVVGYSKGERIMIPNVLGLSLKEGTQKLKAALLNVAPMEKGDGACVSGVDSTLARIYMQRPACGEAINIGKEVSVFFTCDTTFNIKTDCK